MNGVETEQVRRARDGDREAFAALVEGSWQSLVRLARSVLGDGEAEDAVQDGLVMAWSKLRSLKDLDSYAAWLTRIVLRGCLKRARKRLRWRPLAEAPEGVERQDPDSAIDVERLLQVLAPRQRAVLHLTTVEGMTDREIAGLMSITAGSVRAHRRRARQSLERHLATFPNSRPRMRAQS